ncbi:MAG TPA: hypothetical protein VNT81_08055 [Vicinamibacterales bacterium]|nr:hypothetical protein [Vicinamibacterales bacterium]
MRDLMRVLRHCETHEPVPFAFMARSAFNCLEGKTTPADVTRSLLSLREFVADSFDEPNFGRAEKMRALEVVDRPAAVVIGRLIDDALKRAQIE